MHLLNKYAYGLWGTVVFNILFFGLFILSAFRPRTKRDWRTMGAFTAFIVALFSEMFGFPLTIYILTSVLGNKYPVLDPFTHLNGHLWATAVSMGIETEGKSKLLKDLVMVAGMIVVSLIIFYTAWS